MRLSICMSLAAVLVLSVAAATKAQVTFIPVYGGFADSDLVASADTIIPSSSNSKTVDVASLPYNNSASTSADSSKVTSSVTGNLSTSAFDFTYSQTDGADDANAGGNPELYFKAGSGTMFSLTGNLTLSGGATDTIVVLLTNLTTSAQVYSSNNLSFTDSGPLVSGDTYQISADVASATLSSTGGLSGSVDLTFSNGVGATVPLPAAGPAVLVLGLLIFGMKYLRRAVI